MQFGKRGRAQQSERAQSIAGVPLAEFKIITQRAMDCARRAKCARVVSIARHKVSVFENMAPGLIRLVGFGRRITPTSVPWASCGKTTPRVCGALAFPGTALPNQRSHTGPLGPVTRMPVCESAA